MIRRNLMCARHYLQKRRLKRKRKPECIHKDQVLCCHYHVLLGACSVGGWASCSVHVQWGWDIPGASHRGDICVCGGGGTKGLVNPEPLHPKCHIAPPKKLSPHRTEKKQFPRTGEAGPQHSLAAHTSTHRPILIHTQSTECSLLPHLYPTVRHMWWEWAQLIFHHCVSRHQETHSAADALVARGIVELIS